MLVSGWSQCVCEEPVLGLGVGLFHMDSYFYLIK